MDPWRLFRNMTKSGTRSDQRQMRKEHPSKTASAQVLERACGCCPRPAHQAPCLDIGSVLRSRFYTLGLFPLFLQFFALVALTQPLAHSPRPLHHHLPPAAHLELDHLSSGSSLSPFPMMPSFPWPREVWLLLITSKTLNLSRV